MPPSSPSSSKTNVPPPPDPQRKKPAPKKLAILAPLVILVLGLAIFSSLSVFWTSTQGAEIEGPGAIAGYSTETAATPISQLDPVRLSTETAASAKPPAGQNAATATPSPPPEPTYTPEPTATQARDLAATPTSTPTPTVTATHQPTATFTPTTTPWPSPTATIPPVPTATSQAEINHVVIISVDGMRPDALDQANTPTLDGLRARGAYCPSAKTVNISYTLPSHASMLSGMIPEKHGIVWGLPFIGWPGMNGPTLFSVAHDANLETGMVVGKEKLSYLVLPNSVDELFCADAHDTEIKDQAVEFIRSGLPNVLFIHFPDTDRVGHAYGWMSDHQLQSVAFADGLIGEIVAELERGGYLDSTLLIITADHGGHGDGHGDDSPLDRTIPWLAVGPGVPPGVILASDIDTFDTAATAAYALGLPCPEVWDGQPVLEIFQQLEIASQPN